MCLSIQHRPDVLNINNKLHSVRWTLKTVNFNGNNTSVTANKGWLVDICWLIDCYTVFFTGRSEHSFRTGAAIREQKKLMNIFFWMIFTWNHFKSAQASVSAPYSSDVNNNIGPWYQNRCIGRAPGNLKLLWKWLERCWIIIEGNIFSSEP